MCKGRKKKKGKIEIIVWRKPGQWEDGIEQKNTKERRETEGWRHGGGEEKRGYKLKLNDNGNIKKGTTE